MKTLEQAAQEYANNEKRITNSLQNAFTAGAEYALRWIPVSKELPGKGERVLVYSDDLGIQIGYLDMLENWKNSSTMIEIPFISGWRPLELK
jgi:hypothetical protein